MKTISSLVVAFVAIICLSTFAKAQDGGMAAGISRIVKGPRIAHDSQGHEVLVASPATVAQGLAENARNPSAGGYFVQDERCLPKLTPTNVGVSTYHQVLGNNCPVHVISSAPTCASNALSPGVVIHKGHLCRKLIKVTFHKGVFGTTKTEKVVYQRID